MIKIKSYEEVDSSLLEIGKAESVRSKKESEMNEKIQIIRDEYERETADVRDIIAEHESAIQTFVERNREDFETVRNKVLIHGTVGLRTSPPKLLQHSSKFKIAHTIELIKKIFPKLKDRYLREKTELNKEAIIQDYKPKNEIPKDLSKAEADKILDDKKLLAIGLRVDQDEKFTYEIKWESLEGVNS